MPPGLSSIPRFFGSLKVQGTDLDPTFALPTTALAQGQVTPDKIGLPYWNATGSAITAGQLLYYSGWNAANSLPQVSLATRDAFASRATFVALGGVANGAAGVMGKHFALTGVNTAAASVGDPVYLGTGGGTALTIPTAGSISQVVGRVSVAAASGAIEFELLSQSDALQLVRPAASFVPSTIPTTGSAEALLMVPVAGFAVNFRVFGKDALATSDTNYIQYSAVNKGQAGAGSTQMLTITGGASSTKATGGGPLLAYGSTAMVPTGTAANLVCAANDVIAFTATINGTLANTVTESCVSMNFVPYGT